MITIQGNTILQGNINVNKPLFLGEFARYDFTNGITDTYGLYNGTLINGTVTGGYYDPNCSGLRNITVPGALFDYMFSELIGFRIDIDVWQYDEFNFPFIDSSFMYMNMNNGNLLLILSDSVNNTTIQCSANVVFGTNALETRQVVSVIYKKPTEPVTYENLGNWIKFEKDGVNIPINTTTDLLKTGTTIGSPITFTGMHNTDSDIDLFYIIDDLGADCTTRIYSVSFTSTDY